MVQLLYIPDDEKEAREGRDLPKVSSTLVVGLHSGSTSPYAESLCILGRFLYPTSILTACNSND